MTLLIGCPSLVLHYKAVDKIYIRMYLNSSKRNLGKKQDI